MVLFQVNVATVGQSVLPVCLPFLLPDEDVQLLPQLLFPGIPVHGDPVPEQYGQNGTSAINHELTFSGYASKRRLFWRFFYVNQRRQSE